MLQELIIKSMEYTEHLIESNQKELDAIGCGGKAKRASRIITHDGEYICLHQLTYNKIDYFDYTPELYSYLATPSLCSFRVNDRGRTQIELMQYTKSGCRFAIYANRFAYFYNEYCTKAGMSIEQFIEELKSISEKAYRDGWEVDHANDNKENNCSWGLSLIPSKENGLGGKGRLLSNIKPPYYCFIVVTPENEYRIKFGYLVPVNENKSIIGQQWFFHCKNIYNLISFLQSVYRDFIPLDHLPPHLSNWGNPQYLRATCIDQKLYFSGNFETEANMAKILLDMDEDQFTELDGTTKWMVIHP